MSITTTATLLTNKPKVTRTPNKINTTNTNQRQASNKTNKQVTFKPNKQTQPTIKHTNTSKQKIN